MQARHSADAPPDIGTPHPGTTGVQGTSNVRVLPHLQNLGHSRQVHAPANIHQQTMYSPFMASGEHALQQHTDISQLGPTPEAEAGEEVVAEDVSSNTSELGTSEVNSEERMSPQSPRMYHEFVRQGSRLRDAVRRKAQWQKNKVRGG